MPEKQTNYKRELQKHLYFEKGLSCAELSELTEKSIPFTSKYLNELIADGSVVETGYANSTGGRRAMMYSLKADLYYIFSVFVDQEVTSMAVVDMNNNVVVGPKKLELHLQENPASLSQLLEALEDFLATIQIPEEKLTGIGIGMPGFIDVKKGINHSFLYSGEKSITQFIQEKIDLPVFIDNDSSIIGLAEMRLGAGKDHGNVMVINIGWGVGLGMILNGNLFRGQNGFAGEFSHIPVFKNNKICSCGKMGCLETETSLLVIIEKARDGLSKGRISILSQINFDHPEESWNGIVEAAGKGDTFAIELISEAGYNLGLGISILLTLLNPELIILSGRGAAAGKLWLAPIQHAINEHCIPKIAENTQIRVSSLGEKAKMLGPAALVMENFHIRKKDVLNAASNAFMSN